MNGIAVLWALFCVQIDSYRLPGSKFHSELPQASHGECGCRAISPGCVCCCDRGRAHHRCHSWHFHHWRDFHGTDIHQLLVGSFSEFENDVVRAILDGARGSKNGKSVFADFLLLDDLELVVATGAQEQTHNQKKRTSMNHFIAL